MTSQQRVGLPSISPSLLNSSNKWATTAEELTALYTCRHTGAITIRTSLLDGFAHDDAIHQHTFLQISPDGSHKVSPLQKSAIGISSLNTLGYSPISLQDYMYMIGDIVKKNTTIDRKPVIFSVTGSAEAVAECYRRLVNLSCPNIPGKPPPAYSQAALAEYISAIGETASEDSSWRIPVGLKLPPYTYSDQFSAVISALLGPGGHVINFLTSTNTLGSSLLLDATSLEPVLPSANGSGIGGLAGAALHPLALGNVRTFRSMLDEAGMEDVKIIGTGGVCDRAGMERMMKAGAFAVGVGTALGVEGVDVFERILKV